MTEDIVWTIRILVIKFEDFPNSHFLHGANPAFYTLMQLPTEIDSHTYIRVELYLQKRKRVGHRKNKKRLNPIITPLILFLHLDHANFLSHVLIFYIPSYVLGKNELSFLQ